MDSMLEAGMLKSKKKLSEDPLQRFNVDFVYLTQINVEKRDNSKVR